MLDTASFYAQLGGHYAGYRLMSCVIGLPLCLIQPHVMRNWVTIMLDALSCHSRLGGHYAGYRLMSCVTR